MRIRTWLFLGFLTILGACVDSFNPGIDDYLDIPVVEGAITNEPGPYTIRLSRSIALENMSLKPLSGALVIISDDAGTIETLTESEPGVYVTSPTGIQGEVGRQYSISIETGGKIYQSEYETLPDPVEIDSLYTELAYREIAEGPVEGLQFYIDTKPMPDPNSNFLWTYTETYKFRSELKLDYIYVTMDSIVVNHSDTGSLCWRTENALERFTFSAQTHNDSKVTHFPIHYINNLNNKLSERYSVLVSQYTVSDGAYHYWSELGKLQLESGSLYTRQPYLIEGNVKNALNSEDIFLGYFMVAGIAKKRIYVDPPPIAFNYGICEPVVNLFQLVNPWDLTFPLYSMIINSSDEAFADIGCFDCRMNGGTMTKPDFWEE